MIWNDDRLRARLDTHVTALKFDRNRRAGCSRANRDWFDVVNDDEQAYEEADGNRNDSDNEKEPFFDSHQWFPFWCNVLLQQSHDTQMEQTALPRTTRQRCNACNMAAPACRRHCDGGMPEREIRIRSYSWPRHLSAGLHHHARCRRLGHG